ncbi:MAG TPA: ABC transporter ATP-binding protein, partial [Polyangia bacterium]
DPVATKNVDDMIRDISKQTGVTSVVISHDMASTFRIADRISMLYEGKIAVSCGPEEIKGCQLPFVREFVEMSGTVRFDEHVVDTDDDETRPGDG